MIQVIPQRGFAPLRCRAPKLTLVTFGRRVIVEPGMHAAGAPAQRCLFAGRKLVCVHLIARDVAWVRASRLAGYRIGCRCEPTKDGGWAFYQIPLRFDGWRYRANINVHLTKEGQQTRGRVLIGGREAGIALN